jgi:ABC-type spermidine/putrescine transport system permease subunit II
MDTGNYILTAIISYALGIITGIFLKEKVFRNKDVTQANSLVLVVVTMMWAVSMMFDIISPDYDTSPLVHGLMGAIVGFFYKPGGENK